MKKFRQLISVLLVVCAIVSIPAFADNSPQASYEPYDTSAQQTFSIGDMPSDEWDFAMNRPIQFSTPKRIVTADMLEIANPSGIKVMDEPSDPLPKMQTAKAIYGPYSSVSSLDASKWFIIYDDAILKTAVIYNGQQCFEFSDGNTTIYIRCDAFARNTSGSTSLNNELTEAANNKDTPIHFIWMKLRCPDISPKPANPKIYTRADKDSL